MLLQRSPRHKRWLQDLRRPLYMNKLLKKIEEDLQYIKTIDKPIAIKIARMIVWRLFPCLRHKFHTLPVKPLPPLIFNPYINYL